MPRVPLRLKPIAGGYNLRRNQLLLSPGESPDVNSIDFDGESVQSAGGAIKFGNRVAPKPGILTRPDKAHSKLAVLALKSAPVQGYVTIPWSEKQDVMGGDFVEATHGTLTTPLLNRSFNARRGKTGSIKVSFQLPQDEKLYPRPTNPATYDQSGDLRTTLDPDIALDECFIVAQKGGNGMTPMSWALGVVNTGELFDLDVGGGNNIFGTTTGFYAKRRSNYALVFMWLDAPGYGAYQPNSMRYRLDDGVVSETDGGGTGDYCTQAYRAFIAPLFVEPGGVYHVELQLSLDTGSVGTGATPTTAWTEDGTINLRVITDDGALQTFTYDEAAPSSAKLFRYKGPVDSLEYLAKYGVRWSGKDATYLGLGYRCAPWTGGGMLYAGIDSAPLENGGFQITDPSSHSKSNYDDYTFPDQEPSGGNTRIVLHTLEIAHRASETNIELSHTGMVDFGTGLVTGWGDQTGLWSGVAPFGRHPWGVHESAWQGLGVDSAGFNNEALKSYRIVFQRDDVGVTTEQVGGGLISIGTFGNTDAYPTPLGFSGAHIVPEIAAFQDSAAADFGPNVGFTIENNFSVTVRAFRWHQRRLIISDFRTYAGVRSYTSGRAELSLDHEPSLTDQGEPGVDILSGWWPMTDGEGGVVVDRVINNHAVLSPFALPVVPTGQEGVSQVFLSGEGERIKLDLSESPVVKEMLREAMKDGQSGVAIELKLRLPGAVYAIPRRRATPTGSTATQLWEAKFAPVLATWGLKEPGSVDSAVGYDHFETGSRSKLHPLIQFGHHVDLPHNVVDDGAPSNGGDWEPFLHPMGFDVKVPSEEDEDGGSFLVPGALVDDDGDSSLSAWNFDSAGGVNVPLYSKGAEWINQTFTVQFGFHPTGVDENYNVYIAFQPARLFKPSDEDTGSEAEFAYFLAGTVRKRDIERSVIVIGGDADPSERSWMEMGGAVFLDSVRVFGVTAPGALPATSGDETPVGTGKFSSSRGYPQRELEASDILRPVAGSSKAVNLIKGSKDVAPAGNNEFPTTGPETELSSVDRTYLQVLGEERRINQSEQFWKTFPVFYFIESVTTDLATLSTPYAGSTKKAAAAGSFRLLGYTAFGDDLRDKPLPLGRGKAIDYGNTLTKDAVDTESYWENKAPTGVDWRVTLFSPVAAGRSFDIHPRWARGLVSARENPILGIHSLEEKIYAGAQGSLFEVDDRWRGRGPNSTLQKALLFRSFEDPDSGVLFPEADDRLVFGDSSGMALPPAGSETVFDAWIYLDRVGLLQTYAWSGDLLHNPAELPPKHAVNVWLRLANGHPEIAVGSSGLVGAAQPDKGLFVGRSDVALSVGTWTHIRWYLGHVGTSLVKPKCAVGGNPTGVTVSGVEDTLSGSDWMIFDNAVGDSVRQSLMLGVGRDAYEQPEGTTGPVEADRLQGYMHSLAGQMAQFRVSEQVIGAGQDPDVPFDPHAALVTGQTLQVHVFDGNDLGVGHVVHEVTGNQYGLLHSHPFVSLYHEMGPRTQLFSFATYGREVWAANGGRPIIIEDGVSRAAGLLKPASLPTFRFDRLPTFEANILDSGGDLDNDLIRQGDPLNDADLVYHYRVPESAYIELAGDSATDWKPDIFFCFKALFRIDQVTGRIPLYSRRNSPASGGAFIEIRDGVLYFGWWDTDKKAEQTVHLSKATFRPGRSYYVYVCKWYPRGGIDANVGWGSSVGSNWQNSQFDQDVGVGERYDAIIVREVPLATKGDTYDGYTGYDMKAGINYPGGTFDDWRINNSSARACVSFTAADTLIPGLDSDETITVTGSVLRFIGTLGAQTDQIAISGIGKFVLDHLGMLIQISFSVTPQSTNFNGAIFRIVEIISATEVRVVDQNGNAPVFIAADLPAGLSSVVATGVAIVKSPDFDDSLRPDESTQIVNLFGSVLANSPLNGLTPFRGEVFSVAFRMVAGTADGNGNLIVEPDLFEDASVKRAQVGGYHSGCEIGTDAFGTQDAAPTDEWDLPWNGNQVGELQVDVPATNSVGSFNVRAYDATTDPSSSQPNDTGEIINEGSDPTEFHLRTRSQGSGERKLRIQFRDPKNNVRSAPSDEMTIAPAVEDSENPSGDLKLTLEALPVPLDERETITEIYLTISGGATFFKVAEVDAGSSSVEIDVDDLFIVNIQGVLVPDVGAPPYCDVLGVAQSAMWFGSLRKPLQVDGIAWSEQFAPEVVPSGQVVPIDTGDGSVVTALHEFQEKMLVFKRNSVHVASIVAVGIISTRKVSANDGAVSAQAVIPYEGRLYFISDRGPLVMFGQPEPTFIGKRIQPYFADTMDPTHLSMISTAINRRRDQMVFTAKDKDRVLADDRFSVEFDHPLDGDSKVNAVISGHRFSFYRTPTITALGSAVSKDGGPHDLLGGTREGFLVWMDRRDTSLSMLGPDANIWGDPTLVHASGGRFQTGLVDRDFEGPRGATVRWKDANKVDQEGVISGVYQDGAGDLFLLTYTGTGEVVVVPVTAATVSLGAQANRWATNAIDFEAPHLEKQGYFLDVSRVKQASGQLLVEVYKNLEATPVGTITLDMTKNFSTEDIGHLVQEARAISFVFLLDAPAAGVPFDLLDVTVRVTETDNR